MALILILKTALLVAFLSVPGPLSACPLCHSPTAALIRAGLLETLTHGPTILATILPFAVLWMLVMAIDRWDGRKAPTDRKVTLEAAYERANH